MYTRRAFCCASLGLPFLTACSSDPDSDSAQLLQILGQSFHAFGSGDSITREQAAAIPYASIGVRIGNSSQVLLVLETKAGGTTLWTSASRIALELQNGRITRTAGLEHNMSQSGPNGIDPLQSHEFTPRAEPYTYVMDIPDRNTYQALVKYEMGEAGRDTLTIFGTALDVLHAREKGSCSLLDWEFENEYWLDPTSGLVWRSLQNIHPEMDVVEVAILRPPA
jgi:hypothetical protein